MYITGTKKGRISDPWKSELEIIMQQQVALLSLQ